MPAIFRRKLSHNNGETGNLTTVSEISYEVVFRGDVVPGQSIVDVKQRLAELFTADPDRIDGMFSGRPVVIKRGLDQPTAERYQASMQKAGAVVDIRPAANSGESSTQPPVAKTEPASSVVPQLPDEDMELAPVGADVLTPEQRRDFTPANIDTSYMTVAEAGTEVLKEDERKVVPDRDVDTSHLSLDDPQ